MPNLGSSPLGLTSSSQKQSAYGIGEYEVDMRDDVTGYTSLFKNTLFFSISREYKSSYW